MISFRFVVAYSNLAKLNSFFDERELYNVSIFENTNYGFSQEIDANGFPIAKFFDVEVFLDNASLAEDLQQSLNAAFPNELRDVQIKTLENKDWVDLYLKELKPVVLDNFYFYNEYTEPKSDDEHLIPIKLNSALAFGSGHHQTTKSCIMNARFLQQNAFTPSNILDMGCGTGILGICALKIWGNAELVGVDIDPEAVEITNKNLQANGIAAKTFVASDLSIIKQTFDLIFCNILKQPLLELASGFYSKLNPNGYIITSGFIKTQEAEIVSQYEQIGFDVVNTIYMQDWVSIIFKK